MHGIEGVLVLIGLGLLTIPVLLIVALVKIGNAKRRIEALEREVADLRVGVQRSATQQAPAAARATEAETMRSRAPAAPTIAGTPDRTSSDADEIASSIPSDAPEAMRGDAISQDARPTETASVVPPPLPPLREGIAIGATAAQEQDRRDAGLPPQAPPAARPTPPPQTPRKPPADPFAPMLRVIKGWFTEGNVPVKIGVMVLLAGVAALLKYASDQGWVRVPIELRLAGVAAAAFAAFVFAWRQRERKRTFALSLQGGAIGVLMLVAFAAFKLYELMPANLAFGITIVLVAGLGVLAVLQRSLALAVFGILAGFMAPIWLSTGSGNHVALFSYYAVLNLGIFAIAWAQSRGRGAWRVLNLLGFVFTFGIGTIWGVLQYNPQKFATTEPFLLLFFGLYLLIPVFYAIGRGEGRRDLVDGTLVFGVPLVTFALQAGLLHEYLARGERMPLAFSALALAAIYALLGGALHRMARLRPLVESYAVLAVGFATLAVPLALSAGASASVFALEGAALVWLGLRQHRRLPQLSGLLLQGAAAVAYAVGYERHYLNLVQAANGQWVWDALPTPIANPLFMSAMLIALAGFVIAFSYRKTLDRILVALLTTWALAWWAFAGLNEIDTHVPYRYRIAAAFAFVTLSGWLASEARRRIQDLPMLGVATAAALALAIPVALAQSAEHGHPFALWGWTAWALYAVLGWRSLTNLRDTATPIRGVAHGGWWWAWTVAIACFLYEQARLADLGDGWRMAAIVVPVLLHAALLRLRPRVLASPLTQGFADYRLPLDVLASVVLAALWGLSLFMPGNSTPLPWLTVLNPLELTQLAALLLLAHRVWRDGVGSRRGRYGVPAFALTSFVWITFATLRSTHYWANTPWSLSMLDDTEVQTALTVVWSVLGVLGWIFGSRRSDRMLWGAGAALMAIVLLKLLLIDREYLDNTFGIISFIAYGLLCTAVGYFAPAPPARPKLENAA